MGWLFVVLGLLMVLGSVLSMTFSPEPASGDPYFDAGSVVGQVVAMLLPFLIAYFLLRNPRS
ncbi:hypothetical protein OEZ60_01710 [Defluviimonas sp. WL0024]|uniref:Uncharacterized protein n=1 Tax=Albidovulum salinarum TaxID=2984153 RepID=A0ABT2WYG3_9RHOB|nr:hypothetical protein [Defluviimonas sp. WL0024]MCU9846716.1 hypothetical protein [Defluviimonas sp. WL0024]